MAQTLTSWQELGARLAEARKVERLSQAELAAAMELDRTVITKIEAGDRKVDSLELARFAEVLKRSIDWFLSPPLPAIVSRRKTRDADESQADVLLESLARDVSQLIEMKLLEPAEPLRPRSIDSVMSAENAARELRKHLGLPPGPVWNLLAVVEQVGLYAFSLDLQEEALDGSYLRLDKGGVAVVNGRAQVGRRRFTLVHELGHHVFADDFSAEWIVGNGEERERLINAFVIHFLLPRESLLSRWQELNGPKDPRWAAIVLGAEYGVSWTAVLAHLCNLEFIDSETRGRLDASRPRKADYIEGGITLREELKPPVTPPGFGRAVVQAYKRHKVSAERALELLRGTLDATELPVEDQVPLESMLSQLDLE